MKAKYNIRAAMKSVEEVRDKPIELKCREISVAFASCANMYTSQGTERHIRIDIVPELMAVTTAMNSRPARVQNDIFYVKKE